MIYQRFKESFMSSGFGRKFSVFALVLLLSFSHVAAVGFDIRQPVDAENTQFPVDICTSDPNTDGEEHYFEVLLTNVNSDGTVTLQSKTATGTSWTDVDTLGVETEYSSAGEQNYIFEDAGGDITLGEADSKTITINGNEHTFATRSGSDDILPSNNPPLFVYELDGQLTETDLGQFDTVDGVYYRTVSVFSNSSGDFAELEFYEPTLVPETSPGTMYRFKANVDADTDYSQPMYIGCDGELAPVVTEVNADDKNIFMYGSTSDVQTGSSINVNISNKDLDPYNLTLYKSNGQVVGRYQVNGTGETTQIFFEDTIGDIIASWFDDGGDYFSFNPDAETNFMTNAANTYNFYFTTTDDLGFSWRTTDYTVTTSGSNTPPQINTVEGFDGSSWKPINQFDSYGENLSRIRANITDPNNVRVNANLTLIDQYDNHYRLNNSYYTQRSSNLYYWNLSQSMQDITDSGSWQAFVSASDEISTVNETRSWSVPWGNFTYTLLKPANDTSVPLYTTFQFQVRASCSGGECFNENQSVTLWPDPVPVESNPVRRWLLG